jgi:superfamily II DNA or RNA helicase
MPQGAPDRARWEAGAWAIDLDRGEPCRVIGAESAWGRDTVLVWFARQDTVVRVPASRLGPAQALKPPSAAHLSYAAAAARVADALAGDVLLAPLSASVVPLPHQVSALQRAVSGDRVRYLLADEVGLGKTIEAGLIATELKARGLVRRTLIVAPAGLTSQWALELKTHFGETFRVISAGGASTGDEENVWRRHDQVICSQDGVKPIDARRGWNREQLRRYNRERFENLVSAGWDLIIIDEAHRLGGSSPDVARFRLGEGLAEAAPYLLLLSATPHQGKTDAFRRLLRFLDPDAVPDADSVRRENVAPYVIRTEKRRAIDAEGQPLFKPRLTSLVPVAWDASGTQRALYEAVTDYVRLGYGRAVAERRPAVGFLMVLIQRLVTSSTAAIRSALERRQVVLETQSQQLELTLDEQGADPSGLSELEELDGAEQLERVIGAASSNVRTERDEVAHLASMARQCEARGPDVKAEALMDIITRLGAEFGEPELKVLVFTEFTATQSMLAEFLGQRGISVVTLNGGMDVEQRKTAQATFRGSARVLVSTDAGGEGLNLQFCHVVVNYDLPWNPMRIEQRIGRVDRIGQTRPVRALNLALEDTVELRVREVLEEKLARILEEFGVDKLGDVLDSGDGGVDFEALYADALLGGASIDDQAAALAQAVRERAAAAQAGAALVGSAGALDPEAARKLATHPLPHWLERMRDAHAESLGIAVSAAGEGPPPSVSDPAIRALVAGAPGLVPGQPIAIVNVPGVSEHVDGVWSLWRVRLDGTDGGLHQAVFPVFVSAAGRTLGPTARLVWDRLVEGALTVVEPQPTDEGDLEVARTAAEAVGKDRLAELEARHRVGLEAERRKRAVRFAAERRAAERVGLPEVRAFRLARIAEDERRSELELAQRARTTVSLTPLMLLAVRRL